MFANRYLEAFTQHQNGQTPSQCWLFSFAVAEQWWPIVLQHLLLGMNGHINLDLGIAVARTTPQEELPAFEHDFNQINTLLAGLVDDVTKRLAKVWPLLAVLD